MTKDNDKAAPDASGGAKAAAVLKSTDAKYKCKAPEEPQTSSPAKKEKKKKNKTDSITPEKKSITAPAPFGSGGKAFEKEYWQS